jgi:hypothetical protein
MPGIHPASRKQVRWAFAAEARGQFRPKADTTWTSSAAKADRSLAREWAHRYKCWTWDDKKRQAPMPKDCKAALELLRKIRTEHPDWIVPPGVLLPKQMATVTKIFRRPPPPGALPVAARYARAPKKRMASRSKAG